MRSATAAAEPWEDPPGVCLRLWGLRVGPGSVNANSAVTVLPTMIAPASRSSVTHDASFLGRCSLQIGEPYAVGIPRVSKISLIATGIP